jgi:hypothetical protein
MPFVSFNKSRYIAVMKELLNILYKNYPYLSSCYTIRSRRTWASRWLVSQVPCGGHALLTVVVRRAISGEKRGERGHQQDLLR